MDYHPGGWDELIKGAGKDATNLFNKAHRYNQHARVILSSKPPHQNNSKGNKIFFLSSWVDYKSIISVCLVGKFTLNTSPDDAKIHNVSMVEENMINNDISKQKVQL